MKPLSIALLLAFAFLSACAPRVNAPSPDSREQPADAAPIAAALDLTDISADRLRVEIDPGAFSPGEVLFRLPRVIPGTYKVYDFGQYTEGLEAYDYDGARLSVEQTDPNTWRIGEAERLDRVVYYVNDTFDLERESGEAGFSGRLPFSPSGTNIDPDAFVLNLHGFVGYFEGMTESAYELRITAPVGLAKAASLPLVASDTTAQTVTDVYRAERYFAVTDNPMFYGDLDVASFDVDGIEVTLGLYSPNGVHSAATVAEVIHRMMDAQRDYLGDLETTDRYNVYLFLFDSDSDQPTGTGALEHHTSTVVTLPEAMPAEALAGAMVDVVSHEFFHIVSPLTVHSEDVHYFDYHAPTFSKHLWLYEGQTEYFASHFQVYEGLESREEFYKKMAGKIDAARGYDDAMSFTEMSERVIDEPYQSAYLNVYYKGALVGMCNDIAVRRRSGGERSLIGAMQGLQARYGTDRPFEDDTFFDEFAAFTTPEVGDFLRTHIEGTTPIDYADCLAPVGLTVRRVEMPSSLFILHPPGGGYVLYVTPASDGKSLEFPGGPLNTTLAVLGVEGGDVLKSFNGIAYTVANASALLQVAAGLSPDAEVTLVVERDGSELTLAGTLGRPVGTVTAIEEVPEATPEQVALRNAWLGDVSP